MYADKKRDNCIPGASRRDARLIKAILLTTATASPPRCAAVASLLRVRFRMSAAEISQTSSFPHGWKHTARLHRRAESARKLRAARVIGDKEKPGGPRGEGGKREKRGGGFDKDSTVAH